MDDQWNQNQNPNPTGPAAPAADPGVPGGQPAGGWTPQGGGQAPADEPSQNPGWTPTPSAPATTPEPTTPVEPEVPVTPTPGSWDQGTTNPAPAAPDQSGNTGTGQGGAA